MWASIIHGISGETTYLMGLTVTQHVLLVGFGYVGQFKVVPALAKLAQMPDFHKKTSREPIELRVIATDPKKSRVINQLREEIESQNSVLTIHPLLKADKYEDQLGDTQFDLVYIASPNETHAQYLAEFLERAHHILVEKPLVDHLADLTGLEDRFQPAQFDAIQLIDHYLFKDAVSYFFTHAQGYVKKIGRLEQLSFSLIEENPIRQDRKWLYQTGMIRDLAVHGLSLIFKLSELGILSQSEADLTLRECQKAWYDPLPVGIQNSRETAAILHYSIETLPFTITVGKGAGFIRKQLQLTGEKGTLTIDTSKKMVTLEQNNRVERLFRAPPSDLVYPEYLNLLNLFFYEPRNVGLPYPLAKKQIQLFEATDKITTGVTYPVGTFPFW